MASKKDTEVKLKKPDVVIAPDELEQKIDRSELVDNYYRLFKQVAVTPTETPKNSFDQIQLKLSGGVYELFAYFPEDNSWKSVTLT